MAYWDGTVHHLRLTEVKAVTDFLWQVRRATSLSGFVATVLQDLKALIPSDIVSYNEFHAAPPMINTTTLPKSVLPPESTAAVTRHYRDHPLLLHQLRTGDGSPRRIIDMTSMRMFRRTALWSELYRPLRFRSEIALALPAPAGAARCVALDRDGSDFSERDLELDVRDSIRHLPAIRRPSSSALRTYRHRTVQCACCHREYRQGLVPAR